jgi:hypothetical protein
MIGFVLSAALCLLKVTQEHILTVSREVVVLAEVTSLR